MGRGGFDRIAPVYGLLERLTFGSALQQARTALLSEVAPRRALLVGEGEGRLAEALLQRYPDLCIVVVDASSTQLERARRRLLRLRPSGKDMEFVHADVTQPRRLPSGSPSGFDLMATPFFLDCFEGKELERVVQQLAQHATADADWIVADFAPAGQGWGRWRRRLWHWGLYAFFRSVAGIESRRLEDPGPRLRACGFELRTERRLRFGLLVAQHWRRTMHESP